MGRHVSLVPYAFFLAVAHFSPSQPIVILDDEDRIVAVLVGRPMAKPGKPDDWDDVIAGMEAAIDKLRRSCTLTKKEKKHRRGPHPAKACGISHGGGQTVSLHAIKEAQY